MIGNSQKVADVEFIGGKNRVATDSIVTVEEVFGQDPFPDSYFTITRAGAQNDTIRVQVAATTGDTSSPDRDVAAVDLTYTLIAADAGDELKLRDNLIAYLNAQSSFTNAFLKAKAAKDLAVIHIASTKRSMGSEFYERPNPGDFAVSVTGTTTVLLGYDTLKSRGKATSLARDPDSPHRLGILGIAGSVTVTAQQVSDIYIANALNAGSPNMRVNGSVTPVIFSLPLDPDFDIFIEELRFYGGGNGVKFEQFLSQNSALTNGVELSIKSDDGTILVLPVLKTTEDFKNKFSFGSGANFRIDVQAGSDQFLAEFNFDNPFVLRKTGTYATDDYCRIKIQDNLSAGISEFELIAKGFKKLP